MDEMSIKDPLENDPSNKCLSGFITVPTVDDGNFSCDIQACNANVFMLGVIDTMINSLLFGKFQTAHFKENLQLKRNQ